jgi:hypothetical protein
MALGLGVFFQTEGPVEVGGPRLALALSVEGRSERVRVAPAVPAALEKYAVDAVYRLETGAKTADDYRRILLSAAGRENLPAPPRVRLALSVRNDGPRTMTLDADERSTDLRLDLRGPGALAVDAPPQATLPLEPNRLILAPGESRELHLRRLASRTAGRVQYHYWTSPGEYSLSVRLSALLHPLGGLQAGRPATAESGPIKVLVLPN